MSRREGYRVISVHRTSRRTKRNSVLITSMLALAVVISLVIAIFASCGDQEKRLGAYASSEMASSEKIAQSEIESEIVSSAIAQSEVETSSG